MSDPGDENDNFSVTDPDVLREFLDKEGNPPEGEWRPSKSNPHVMEWWGMGELMAEMEQQNASVRTKRPLGGSKNICEGGSEG